MVVFTQKMNVIDLFAGGGGLSEGFLKENFNIITKIEKDRAACETLITRGAFHDLKKQGKLTIYKDYLKGKLNKNEMLEECKEFNEKSVICDEINEDTIQNLISTVDEQLGDRDLDVIIGGPPCQAYSLVGRARNNLIKDSDERVYLYKFYMEFLKHYKPKLFLFENVKGLLSFKDVDGKLLLPKILKDLSSIGYNVEYTVLDASEYGVPQKRERVFIVGYREKIEKGFFEALEDFKQPCSVTIEQLFKDLPSLKAGESYEGYQYNEIGLNNMIREHIRADNWNILTQHIARPHNENDLEIYKIVSKARSENINFMYNNLPSDLQKHKNTLSFLDRFKALNGKGLSHTITAHISKDGHYYIHYDVEQNRSISVREAARIQTFPDDYYFETSRTSAFNQIGNAVPPLLARKLANNLKGWSPSIH